MENVEPTHPSVSTGTYAAKDFVDSFNIKPDAPLWEPSKDRFMVSIRWKGNTLTKELGPEDWMAPRSKERIESPISRLFTATYLVLRDGNRCAPRTEFCIMGAQPFEHPESANFDHMDGDRHHHELKNLRLSCQTCNSHLQWKQKLTPAFGQSEKEKAGTAQPEASSLETAKHDPQRAAWDRIIEDGSLFKKLDDLNLMVLTSKGGKLYQAQDMAEAAVYLTIDKVFGKYSSETFMRYAREDRFGPLEMLKDGGRWWVRPKERHTQ